METVKRIFDLLNKFTGESLPDRNVFGYRRNGIWLNISLHEYISKAGRITEALIAFGLRPGDRVATITRNIPEWNFLDIGIMQAGCVHVPVYPSLSYENYRYIFNDADVKLIITGCRDAYERIETAVDGTPWSQCAYAIEQLAGVPSWDAFLDKYAPLELLDFSHAAWPEVDESDLATLIYTSGTTGQPKGVMLSHRNIVTNFLAVSSVLKGHGVNRALSFLPLCHIYERTLNYVYQYLGIQVFYAENFDRVRDYLCEVKPEMFCAVPRVIEKAYSTLLRKGKNLPFFRKAVFFKALNLALKYDKDLAEKRSYRLQMLLADRLVFCKWREAFGGNIKYIVSGGAPLNEKLARIFWAAGMKIIEGYGLTETSPVIATGTLEPGGVKFGTVGPVLPGVEIKLSVDGEVLCKGPGVMMGYFNKPGLTSAAFDNEGWFKTGDVGEIIDGKYLKISDRKKEIFKTSSGKYVAPQVIEKRMKESPFIESMLVVGEYRNYVSALIVPNFDYLRSWCRAKEIEYRGNEEMVKHDRVIGRIQREINTLNAELDRSSQIKRFRLLGREWTVETGELSYTLKVRRTHLQQKFAGIIESMYQGCVEYHPGSKKKIKKKKNRHN